MNIKWMRLYNQDTGDTGGGSEDYGSDPSSMDDGGLNQQVASVEPVKPSFSQDDLIKSVREGVTTAVGQLAPKPQEQTKQLSQEEMDRIFKRAVVTADDMHKLGLAPDAAGHLQAIVDRIAGNAKQLAAYEAFVLKDNLERRFNEFYTNKFTPIEQEHLSKAEKNLEEDFFKQHADLQSYKPLLVEIKNNMVANRMVFRDKASAFNALASRARELLKSSGLLQTQPSGDGGVRQQTVTTNTRRMTPVSSGGQVGSANGGGAKTSTAASIFG